MLAVTACDTALSVSGDTLPCVVARLLSDVEVTRRGVPVTGQAYMDLTCGPLFRLTRFSKFREFILAHEFIDGKCTHLP